MYQNNLYAKYFKSFKWLFYKKSKINFSEVSFDKQEFRDKTYNLEDSFIRKHAIDIIDNGYTVIKNSVSNESINTAIDSFYDWKERNHKKFDPSFYKFSNKLDRIVNIQANLPIFKKLWSENQCLKITDYLFNSETSFYTSLFFEAGSSQEIHRDVSLFWTNPCNLFFGTWLALEGTDSENGPLLVIPKSHKLDLLDRDDIRQQAGIKPNRLDEYEDSLWQIYNSKLQNLCSKNNLEIKEVHVNKGDTIVWHPMLAHGGKEILDKERTRLSHVVHVVPYKTPVYRHNIFFNSNKKVPISASWSYETFNNRFFNKYENLSIKHIARYNFKQLK